MCKMPPKYGPWYQPRLFIKDSWSNAHWFLRQFSFRCRWQRIRDCFRTMWVLSFPNYCPTKLVPPTSNIQQYILHLFPLPPLFLLFFSANISESQCFETKQKTRRRKLKNLWWAREPQNGFHSIPTLPDRPPLGIHCHESWRHRRGGWETKPGFWDSHFGGLRPSGRPGPTATVWLICVKMARSAPKPPPRKNSGGSRLPGTGGHCPHPPLATLKGFRPPRTTSNSVPRAAPLPRNCKQWNFRETSEDGTSGWCNFVK